MKLSLVREPNEENNNIPITLNSILKGNIEDDIKLIIGF